MFSNNNSGDACLLGWFKGSAKGPNPSTVFLCSPETKKQHQKRRGRRKICRKDLCHLQNLKYVYSGPAQPKFPGHIIKGSTLSYALDGTLASPDLMDSCPVLSHVCSCLAEDGAEFLPHLSLSSEGKTFPESFGRLFQGFHWLDPSHIEQLQERLGMVGWCFQTPL